MGKNKASCIDCGKDCWSQANKSSPRCRKCYHKNDAIVNNKLSRVEYARQWAMQKKYKIDLIDFECLWIVFKGKCGICDCDLKMPLPKRGQPLDVVVIDHDHSTGNIRGLLCNGCNKALGLFKESKEILIKAKEYLTYEKTSNNSQDK